MSFIIRVTKKRQGIITALYFLSREKIFICCTLFLDLVMDLSHAVFWLVTESHCLHVRTKVCCFFSTMYVVCVWGGAFLQTLFIQNTKMFKE